jgi:hypothetical protein
VIAAKLQLIAIALTGGLLLLILELIRRRRLMERYSLLWLFSAAVLFVLAVWKGLLASVASLVGISTASNALFVIAFGFVLVLLLHFSLVVSRLADQNKVLAQRLGLLQQQVEELRSDASDAGGRGSGAGSGSGSSADAAPDAAAPVRDPGELARSR